MVSHAGDEKLAKLARVEVAPSPTNGGLVMRSNLGVATQPSYGAITHTLVPVEALVCRFCSWLDMWA